MALVLVLVLYLAAALPGVQGASASLVHPDAAAQVDVDDRFESYVGFKVDGPLPRVVQRWSPEETSEILVYGNAADLARHRAEARVLDRHSWAPLTTVLAELKRWPGHWPIAGYAMSSLLGGSGAVWIDGSAAEPRFLYGDPRRVPPGASFDWLQDPYPEWYLVRMVDSERDRYNEDHSQVHGRVGLLLGAVMVMDPDVASSTHNSTATDSFQLKSTRHFVNRLTKRLDKRVQESESVFVHVEGTFSAMSLILPNNLTDGYRAAAGTPTHPGVAYQDRTRFSQVFPQPHRWTLHGLYTKHKHVAQVMTPAGEVPGLQLFACNADGTRVGQVDAFDSHAEDIRVTLTRLPLNGRYSEQGVDGFGPGTYIMRGVGQVQRVSKLSYNPG